MQVARVSTVQLCIWPEYAVDSDFRPSWARSQKKHSVQHWVVKNLNLADVMEYMYVGCFISFWAFLLWEILLEWKTLNIAASKLCFTPQSATKQHSATFLHLLDESALIFWFALWFPLWFIMSHAGICHTDACFFCAISINGLSPIVNWFVTLSVGMD